MSTPPAAAAAAEVVDGRRARRERGREAVIDAMLDLILEGGAPPTTEAVAGRAGVSTASIFRYFDNLDDLRHQATLRFLERHAHLYEVPGLGEGPLPGRIDRFVEARVALHEAIEPIARVVRVRAPEHPHLAGTLDDTRRQLADQARTHFAPELADRPRASADDLVGLVATVTAFESWDHLRHSLGRTRRQVTRSWESALRALLTI
jgi:AcrR family transcriptional regulator